MEKTQSMNEEMDGEVFYYHQSRHFPFTDNMNKVLFPIFTSIWRLSNYVSRQGKGINRRNESIFIIIRVVAFWYCTRFVEIITCLSSLKLFPHINRRSTLLLQKKLQFSFHSWQNLYISNMAIWGVRET